MNVNTLNLLASSFFWMKFSDKRCHFTRSEQTSDDGLLSAPSQKVIESNSFPLIHNPLEDQVQGAITWSAIFRPTDSRVLSEAVAS